jgi:hypothetical protein
MTHSDCPWYQDENGLGSVFLGNRALVDLYRSLSWCMVLLFQDGIVLCVFVFFFFF